MAGFFDLPFEQKKKYSLAENDIQGYGQPRVVSQEQKIDWYDTILLVMRPHQYRNMKYWPVEIPGFKYETYSNLLSHFITEGSKAFIFSYFFS